MEAEFSFQGVMYAGSSRMDSRRKILMFDDRGELRILPARLQFEGKKFRLDIEKILDVYPARMAVSIYHLAIILIFTPMMLFWMYLWVGEPRPTILIVMMNLMLIFVITRQRWSCIVFRDAVGETKKAFFKNEMQMFRTDSSLILNAVRRQFQLPSKTTG